MNQAMKQPKADDVKVNRMRPEANRRILVVDDEPSIAEGIKALLAPDGGNVVPFRRSSRSSPQASSISPLESGPYDITVVTSPADALAAVRKSIVEGKPFAMGFFDVLLGAEIDGIELVRQVQSLDPDIFAVFVTAYHDRSVDSINDYLGATNGDRWDYINKPFTDGEIVQKARNFTSHWNLKKLKQWQEEQLADAQRTLLENERMSTVAAIGRSVAHEFGNLLMQIVGHAELAVMKNEPQRMKEALETILKASDTATAVLNRFKKLAQGNPGSGELKLMNIHQPLEEALELMNYQFKKSQIQVVKDKMDQVLLEANRHSLVQVFMNVFINAVHAMPNGGRLNLSIQKTDDKFVEVKIRDDGSGIPVEILPRVTQALFTTKGENGSGLGLAICKEIIEIEHHGQFLIENHPEKGVVVTLRIPTRQEAGSAKHDET